MSHADLTTDIVVIGKIGAPYGIKGWVHVQSFTTRSEDILQYPVWKLKCSLTKRCRDYVVTQSRQHGANYVALLSNMHDRDSAALLTNAEIAVLRDDLPALETEDEYYWSDLVGLNIVNLQDVSLGVVTEVIATGANDVLVVEKGETQVLIPFILEQYVLSVDLAKKIIQVDWELDCGE
jgi:16S rRNA processing protein RimM